MDTASLCSPDSLQEAVVVGAGVPAIPLTSINAVTRYIPSIDEARVKITEEMESMLRDGLRDLVCYQVLYATTYLSSLTGYTEQIPPLLLPPNSTQPPRAAATRRRRRGRAVSQRGG